MFMKWISMMAVLMAGMLPGAWAKPSLDISLVQGWTIVVAEEAIPSEKYAAAEMQKLLEESIGAKLPIQSKPPELTRNIFIGPSAAMETSSAGVKIDDLGDEGVRIRIETNNVAIAGGRPRGTLYAVYEFAERYLGVRFLTFDHTYVPKLRRLQIPCETWQYVPPFTFRWSYYKETADHPEFAARVRVNTVSHDEKLGGSTPQSLISHSLSYLLPVDKYGKDHPEYFALVDGKRQLQMGGGGPELCISNPEVIEIVAQNVIKALDQHPQQKNFSVSQNDNDAYCRCEKCEAINQREGTPMGSHLAFVNAVAERVERKYPDVKIGTLAYWYTRKTPKTIKPRPNVQIQLCSIECSTLYPLDDPHCAKNVAFCADMDAWSKVCNDIWIWNYNTNFRFYDLPFPNLRVIGPNLRYFLKNHVKGVFMQANGNANGGELCDLRNYVLARCLWNPQFNSWEVAKEFCRLHYGRAGETMIAYLTYLHNNAEQSGFAPTCFPMPFELGLNAESADRIFSFFQKALKQAENETVRNRVEKASICAYRAVLEAAVHWEFRYGMLRAVFPDKYGDVVNDYIALTKKHGQTRAEEWQPIEHYYQILRKATQEGYHAARLENQIWRLTVVGDDNGKLIELRHKPDNRELLMPAKYRDLRHAFEHLTLSEMGEQGYNHAEPSPFEITKERSGLLLTKTLKDGTKVQRHLAFDEKDPGIIRCETTLTHQGTEPQSYQLRVHPEFHTGRATTDARVVSAYVRDGNWVRFNEGWHEGEGPKRDELDRSHPTGYAFYNHPDRFGMMLTCDPSWVGRPAFWWSDTYPEANLDLYTKLVRLKTGESFSFQYSLQYLDHPPHGEPIVSN
jgi:hypothetical protein